MTAPTLPTGRRLRFQPGVALALLMGGAIACGGRHGALPCVVRDMSETGARLQVQDASLVADGFELLIEPFA